MAGGSIDLEALKRGAGVEGALRAAQQGPSPQQLLISLNQQMQVQNVVLDAIMRLLMGIEKEKVIADLQLRIPGVNVPTDAEKQAAAEEQPDPTA